MELYMAAWGNRYPIYSHGNRSRTIVEMETGGSVAERFGKPSRANDY